jgi:hypothetical protein
MLREKTAAVDCRVQGKAKGTTEAVKTTASGKSHRMRRLIERRHPGEFAATTAVEGSYTRLRRPRVGAEQTLSQCRADFRYFCLCQVRCHGQTQEAGADGVGHVEGITRQPCKIGLAMKPPSVPEPSSDAMPRKTVRYECRFLGIAASVKNIDKARHRRRDETVCKAHLLHIETVARDDGFQFQPLPVPVDEFGQSDGRVVFAHFAIGPRHLGIAVATDTEIQRLNHALHDIDVGRDDAAALASSEAFGCMEAQRNRNRTEKAGRSLRDAIEARGTINYNWDACTFLELPPRLLQNWAAEGRYGNDESRTRERGVRFKAHSVEAPAFGIDIDKVRSIAALLHRVRRGDEGEGWHQGDGAFFAGPAGDRQDGADERRGTGARAGYAFGRYREVPREPGLQLRQKRAVVGINPRGVDAAQIRQQPVSAR